MRFLNRRDLAPYRQHQGQRLYRYYEGQEESAEIVVDWER